MEIKTHPGFTALSSSHQTTMKELSSFGGAVSNELYPIAVNEKLLIGGPIYWNYIGLDANPDTVFTLQILLPVTGNINHRDGLPITVVPALRCASLLHYGPWDKLPETYDRLMEGIREQDLQQIGVFREVYINVDFNDQQNNITEVHVGIA